MMQLMTLIGAYGKNYQTPEQAMKAWEEGKDFKIIGAHIAAFGTLKK